MKHHTEAHRGTQMHADTQTPDRDTVTDIDIDIDTDTEHIRNLAEPSSARIII